MQRELLAELFEDILTQQLLLKGVEDALLDFITSNGQAIRARALVSCAKAHHANERSQRFVAMIERRTSCSASRPPIRLSRDRIITAGSRA
jgi:hypothetical protein